MDVTLVALHGFLGEPADWRATFEQLPPAVKKIAPDYTQDPLLNPDHANLERWGEAFRNWRHREGLPAKIVLLGYSQGGRLALHALAADPEAFHHVVCVSANSGLPADDPSIRAVREKNDAAWAERFLHQHWDDVITAWNRQAVFGGGAVEPPRQTHKVDAGVLAAHCLNVWSLAKQQDFHSLLEKETRRLHWVVGENDEKFRWQALQLQKEIPGLHVELVSGAGHRVPLDSPRELGRLLSEIIHNQID